MQLGRLRFQAFSWIELSVFVLLVCASLKNLTRGVVVGILLLCLMLLIQKFGILPGLDTELDRTVAGENSKGDEPSFLSNIANRIA